MNILHIVVLSRMQELKSTKFFWALIHLSINEIISCISLLLYFGCELKLAIFNLPAVTSYWMFAGIRILTGYVVLCRYMIMLFSILERYIAVLHPHDYKTNTFVRNINLIICGSMIPLLLLPILVDRVTFFPFCKTPLIVDYESGKALLPKIFYFTCVALFTVSISALQVKLWKKLKSLAEVQVHRERNRKLKTASKYVIWTYITYQLMSFPIILFLVLKLTNLSSYAVHTIQAITVLIGSCYGPSNILVFAYFNSEYRKVVKKIFNCRSAVNRVEPANNM